MAGTHLAGIAMSVAFDWGRPPHPTILLAIRGAVKQTPESAGPDLELTFYLMRSESHFYFSPKSVLEVLVLVFIDIKTFPQNPSIKLCFFPAKVLNLTLNPPLTRVLLKLCWHGLLFKLCWTGP